MKGLVRPGGMKMEIKSIVGMILGIPPYGLLLKPLGETLQLVGLCIQFVGVALCVWGAYRAWKRRKAYRA